MSFCITSAVFIAEIFSVKIMLFNTIKEEVERL